MLRRTGPTQAIGVAHGGTVRVAAGVSPAGRKLTRPPAALLASCLAVAALAILAVQPVHAPRSASSRTSERRFLPAGLIASASPSIGASERSLWPARSGGSLIARGGGISDTFAPSGASLKVAQGVLSLSPARAGHGASAPASAAGAPSVAANVVSYGGAALTETYRNGPYGLEQSFVLASRPHGAGPLVISQSAGGSLRPAQAGSEIAFETRSGAAALGYGELSAFDATGRRLPASMAVHGRTLELRIDDRGAAYPVRVDPFIQQGPKLVGGEEVEEAQFGESVAISGDGNTALIGGPADNGSIGAAWVFTRSGTTWTQQGPKLTATGESGFGQLGSSVALSADGDTALIGARRDNLETGAAFVFTRSGSTWTQDEKLTPGGEHQGESQFGYRVALSPGGETALVGAPDDHEFAGAAWVFTRSGSVWTRIAPKLTGAGESGKGEFGESVALSEGGATALIGASADESGVGAAWAFTRAGSTWSQQGPKLTGGEEVGKAHFGFSAALSADGATALIGGGGDNGEVGAAWAFTRSGSTWSQQGAKLTASGEVGMAHFGFTLGLSSDGDTAIIAGGGDNKEAGAAWIFGRSGSTWSQQGSKLTGGEEVGKAHFGYSVAMSGDGETAIAGGLADNNVIGAAWVFRSAPPPPTVTSVTPESGPAAGGTPVTVQGTGFESGASVTIGSAATSVNVISETELTAVTAATAAGSDPVVVSDAKGTSTGGPSFTYHAAPKVTTVTPTSGPSAGGTVVTLKGSGFVAGATVTIGSAATSVTVVSSTTIKATTSATSPGSDEVVVSDANGTSSGGPSFTYTAPALPVVTSVSPVSGPQSGGTTVTIKGSALNTGGTPTVKFGSVTATEVLSASATAVKVHSPVAGSPGVVDVTVTTAAGTSEISAKDHYEYVPPAAPKVTKVTPTSGPTSGGTVVTLKGTGFVAGASVTIGSAATSVNVVSATTIKATTSATAAGSDEVVVSDANGTSTGGPSFTYTNPSAPTVTKVTPTSGPTSGGTVVTLKGTGFVAGASVTIGSAATSVNVVSATTIKATTSATAAGSDEVVVSDANGTSTGGPSFTYTVPPPPVVTSVSPVSGPQTGGTTVTIKGSRLNAGGTPTVRFGSVAATEILSVAAGTVKVVSPSSPVSGVVDVTVTTSEGTSETSASDHFEYVPVAHPPTVASIAPESGPTAGGTPVTIHGTGFLAGASVTIGSAATSVVIHSETEITAYTAATAAGSDEVVVSDSKGTSSGGPSFHYIAPPAVSSISPESGTTLGGTAVTIHGSGFVEGATVTIGSAATAVNVVSATTIKASTSATAAGSDEVVVSDANGTSTGGPSYTYVAPPAPVVTSVAPGSGAFAGGTTVTIKGSNLNIGGTPTVSFGSTAAEVTSATATSVKAVSPAGSAPGVVHVTVTTAAGTSEPSEADEFEYLPPPPPVTVTGVSPASGPEAGGTLVTVNGTGFVEGATVTIGSAAGEVTVISETELTAKTAPGAAGPDEVVVSDELGTSSEGPSFTYLAPPRVTTVTPTSGPLAGGGEVTIKGANLNAGGTPTVMFGASAASVLSASPTTVRVLAPAASSPGVVDVTVTTAGGTSETSEKDEYEYLGPPTVMSVMPESGPAAGATAVTIVGSGFLEGASVTIDGVPAEVLTVSASEITALTGPGEPGTGEVQVTDANGASSGGPAFTYE